MPEQDTTEPATILVVDDMPQNLLLLGELLQPAYQVRAANSGERALRVARTAPRPDLILLDVMMPGMDGHQVLRQLRADPATRDIPVIFVTALEETAEEEHGLALGAVDYITKPIVPPILLARVRAHVELSRARRRLAVQNDWLEAEVRRRTAEIRLVQELCIRALTSLSEARDQETGRHILRTQAYVAVLARHLAGHPRFAEALAGRRAEMLVQAAPLHDIGKVGIPDAILGKPGALTPEEFAVMKTHPAIGARAIEAAMEQALAAADDTTVEQAPGAMAFLRTAHQIALSHHEKWDGTGYPQGLAGEAIPVAARLMSVADVFDALTSRRVYKPALDLEEATRIITAGRGKAFDPEVVDAYLACREEFTAIARRLADPPPPPPPAPAPAGDTRA
ncbi:MAG TPA: HD domain-containing phosphohydrolase [Roseococcus sp.]|jgi:putative two-component system response regulator|nr:HD domain-containing phosphohydrolase [Roseococcus sp.]